jgi:hypothetical protein
MVKTQFDSRIKTIRTDSGTKFLLHSLYQEHGIIHQTPWVETQQQNGHGERRHQDILNVACALLFQANLPKHIWGLAATHAVYLLNRVPTPLLGNISPFEKLFGSKPDFTLLKVFGCFCFTSTLSAHRSKFDLKSHKCIFVGYISGTKGFLVYDCHTKQLGVSRHVLFEEFIFPFHSPLTDPKSNCITNPTQIVDTHITFF